MKPQKIKLNNTSSFRQRLTGLLAYKNPGYNEVLLIENCRAIHTFFMRFPIDVIFTDKHNSIIKMKENLKSFRFLLAGLKARNVYEAPAGFIKRFELKIGDDIRNIL